jgi:hypothetical protein
MKIYLDNTCSAYASQVYAVADFVLRHSEKVLDSEPFWKKNGDSCYIPHQGCTFEVQDELEIDYKPISIKIVKFMDQSGKIWWTTNFHRIM